MSLFRSRRHKHSVYALMLEAIDCGPFDGGCLAFAHAMQQVHGGEVWVIEGAMRWSQKGPVGPVQAQHAVLRAPNGRFADANGWFDGDHELIHGFSASEQLENSLKQAKLRPWREGDLPEAPRHADLEHDLVRTLRASLAQQRVHALRSLALSQSVAPAHAGLDCH